MTFDRMNGLHRLTVVYKQMCPAGSTVMNVEKDQRVIHPLKQSQAGPQSCWVLTQRGPLITLAAHQAEK